MSVTEGHSIETSETGDWWSEYGSKKVSEWGGDIVT